MNSIDPPSISPSPVTLEQLLHREDIWRGQSRRLATPVALDTGYAALNQGLLAKGWPLSSLIEVCQQNLSHSEWLLLTPALVQTPGGYIVLLNPPAMPFAQALIQAGLDLERVLIVQVHNKADFLASFLELTRAAACDAVLAWQPKHALSYTELRKCLLATAEGAGLYVLFRPASAQQQSSPAVLRLLTELKAAELQITVLKEKGALQQRQQAITLALPEIWRGLLPHRLLQQPAPSITTTASRNVRGKLATVTQLHGGK